MIKIYSLANFCSTNGREKHVRWSTFWRYGHGRSMTSFFKVSHFETYTLDTLVSKFFTYIWILKCYYPLTDSCLILDNYLWNTFNHVKNQCKFNLCWFDSYIFVGQSVAKYLDQNLQAKIPATKVSLRSWWGHICHGRKTKRWKNHRTKGWIFQQTMERSPQPLTVRLMFLYVFHGPSMTQDKHQLTSTLFGQPEILKISHPQRNAASATYQKFSIRRISQVSIIWFFESAFIPHHGVPYPLVNIQKNCGKTPLFMGNSAINSHFQWQTVIVITRGCFSLPILWWNNKVINDGPLGNPPSTLMGTLKIHLREETPSIHSKYAPSHLVNFTRIWCFTWSLDMMNVTIFPGFCHIHLWILGYCWL